MASNALEEKINKIKLQNEEIQRRHEEVEADKKNAAKLNALVKMVPSNDWPERKEPPEFNAPSKNSQKQKFSNKEYSDRHSQHYSGIQERYGKKDHKFAQGDGPPPDPKYNFLADSEREIRINDNGRADENKNRGRNKSSRGGSKKRGGDGGAGSRDAFFKDNRGPHAFCTREEALPEYEAWRAERNRIDEARINRQKTAEGNWRREWDSNKTNIEKESTRKGDSNRKDSNNFERRNNHYDNDYSNRGHGGGRSYGSQKNHNQDYRRSHHEQSNEHKRQIENKRHVSPPDDRTVTATDKNIKVTLNHGMHTKGPVMSVKVNSPSIAGTGRVGPRQKSRITYSSQSDADVTIHEINNFSRQKSFDEKTVGASFNNGQKSSLKSPYSQRKKDGNSKSPYNQRKELKNDEQSSRSKIIMKAANSHKNESSDLKQSNNVTSKGQRNQKRNHKQSSLNEDENNLFISDEAIPYEYNPDKCFSTREYLIKETIDNRCENFEKASKANKSIEEFSDTTEAFNNSNTNDRYINMNNYANHTENISYQNTNDIEINEINDNNEHIKINENIKTINTLMNIEEVSNDKIIENEQIQNMKDEEINKNIEDKSIVDITDETINKNIESEIILKNIEHIKIYENIENEKIDDDVEKMNYNIEDNKIDDNINDENIDKNVEFMETNKNVGYLQNNCVEENYINTNEVNESFENDKYNIEASNIAHEIREQKSNENAMYDSKIIIDTMEEKNHLCDTTQENLNENISNDEKKLSLEIIKKNELRKTYDSEEIKINLEQQNDQSEKITDDYQSIIVELKTDYEIDCRDENLVDNIKNNVELRENKTTAIMNSINKFDKNISDFIDNDIIDKPIDFNKMEATEIINSDINSPNDSGFVDDYDKFDNSIDATIIESTENNTDENSMKSVISDIIELTKEVYNENIETCDIYSVASNELIDVTEGHPDKLDNKIGVQDAITLLESNTKDNEVCIINSINKDSKAENHVLIKEERNDISMEVEQLDNEELKECIKEVTTVVDNIGSISITSESTKLISDESVGA